MFKHEVFIIVFLFMLPFTIQSQQSCCTGYGTVMPTDNTQTACDTANNVADSTWTLKPPCNENSACLKTACILSGAKIPTTQYYEQACLTPQMHKTILDFRQQYLLETVPNGVAVACSEATKLTVSVTAIVFANVVYFTFFSNL